MVSFSSLDLINIRAHNIPKLVTKEDFNHAHKILGILCLIHYIYRLYLFSTTGTMKFDDSAFTFLSIAAHFILSISSLIFKIPDTRIRSSPMIYPEFRLHSILFASRSLAVMLLLYFTRKYDAVAPHYFRGLIVLATLYLADAITNSFKDQGKTMRAMPFPDYIPQSARDLLNRFYSVSQIFATAQIIFSIGLDEPFLVLFPIQIAAFLMTCVRKSIISAGAWHFYYAASLGLNYVISPMLRYPNSDSIRGGLFYPAAFAAIVFRFYLPNVSKYVVWLVICLVHLYAVHYLGKYNAVVI